MVHPGRLRRQQRKKLRCVKVDLPFLKTASMTVHPFVVRFCGIYNNIMRMGPESGAGDAYYVQRAMIHYEIDTGLPFKLRHCWEILKDHPKWQEIAIPRFNTLSEGGSKRHKSTGSSSFNTESGEASINLNTNVDDNDEDEVDGNRDGCSGERSLLSVFRDQKEGGNMIDGSDLTNYGFATYGFVGTAFDDDHRNVWPWEGNVETDVGSLNGKLSILVDNIYISIKDTKLVCLGRYTIDWYGSVCSFMYSNIKFSLKFRASKEAAQKGKAKQPLWPRGKAINESAANKKEIDVPPGIREVKAMADMHQRKAGTAKHSDNEEDVEVSEEKTHDIDTSQSLQKVEQHLQTLCFSAHRSL
ncbi:gamma-glutamyltranspeptidase 1 [Tanacetum coccineum]